MNIRPSMQGLSPFGPDVNQAFVEASEKANYGKSTQFLTTLNAGVYQPNPQGTTLIADVHTDRDEWIVTLQPLGLQQTGGQTFPWADNFAGTPTSPGSASVFQAPLVPQGGFAVLLQWGAGGMRLQSQFDYPPGGAVFGVACETLNLDVILKPAFGTPFPGWSSLGLVPMVGAFMTSGTPVDRDGLHWEEVPVPQTSGTPLYWPIRPFARSLDIHVDDIPAGKTVTLTWLRQNGAGFSAAAGWANTLIPGENGYAGVHATLEIPPLAMAYSVDNSDTGNAHPVNLLSRIELA